MLQEPLKERKTRFHTFTFWHAAAIGEIFWTNCDFFAFWHGRFFHIVTKILRLRLSEDAIIECQNCQRKQARECIFVFGGVYLAECVLGRCAPYFQRFKEFVGKGRDTTLGSNSIAMLSQTEIQIQNTKNTNGYDKRWEETYSHCFHIERIFLGSLHLIWNTLNKNIAHILTEILCCMQPKVFMSFKVPQ